MRKQRMKHIILWCLLALILFPVASMASGNLSMETDAVKIAQGDIVTVTFTFSSDQPIEAIRAVLSYDSKKLAYQSGGGQFMEISGGIGHLSDIEVSGATERSYSVRFMALNTGTTVVSITQSSILATSGDLVGAPTASVQITVDAAKPIPTNSIKEPIPVTINGKQYYVMQEDEGAFAPEGFYQTTYDYEGTTVPAWKNAKEMLLLHVLNQDGQTNFFVYEETTKQFYPFVLLSNVQLYVVMENSIEIEGFEPCTIAVGGWGIPAWQYPGQEEFFLIYALNAEGDRVFYRYDKKENTMQRTEVQVVEPSPSPQPPLVPTQDDEKMPAAYLWIIIALAVICILLLTCIIIVWRKR